MIFKRPHRATIAPAFWYTGIIALALSVTIMGYFLIKRLLLTPPVDAHIDTSDKLVNEGDQIQLNVLNGCGVPGAAGTIMDFLRARGFDVVEIANYVNFDVERSFVIDRVGDTVSLAKVAYALGIHDSLSRRAIDSSLYLRCSVVLGHDFRSLKAYE